jgi:hypothetical protein
MELNRSAATNEHPAIVRRDRIRISQPHGRLLIVGEKQADLADRRSATDRRSTVFSINPESIAGSRCSAGDMPAHESGVGALAPTPRPLRRDLEAMYSDHQCTPADSGM